MAGWQAVRHSAFTTTRDTITDAFVVWASAFMGTPYEDSSWPEPEDVPQCARTGCRFSGSGIPASAGEQVALVSTTS
jgi:hypothetical protein